MNDKISEAAGLFLSLPPEVQTQIIALIKSMLKKTDER